MQLYCKDVYRCGAEAARAMDQRRREMGGNQQTYLQPVFPGFVNCWVMLLSFHAMMRTHCNPSWRSAVAPKCTTRCAGCAYCCVPWMGKWCARGGWSEDHGEFVGSLEWRGGFEWLIVKISLSSCQCGFAYDTYKVLHTLFGSFKRLTTCHSRQQLFLNVLINLMVLKIHIYKHTIVLPSPVHLFYF